MCFARRCREEASTRSLLTPHPATAPPFHRQKTFHQPPPTPQKKSSIAKERYLEPHAHAALPIRARRWAGWTQPASPGGASSLRPRPKHPTRAAAPGSDTRRRRLLPFCRRHLRSSTSSLLIPLIVASPYKSTSQENPHFSPRRHRFTIALKKTNL